MSHNNLKVTICRQCILPETFPGIRFDDHGICSHCRREKSALLESSEKKTTYRNRFDTLIQEVRDSAPTYDAIMAYSGGKDSSYTLKLLKEKYQLRILSLTLDNHFVAQTSWGNIQKVTDALEVDHISFRPPWRLVQKIFSLTAKKDIYPAPALLRASSICTTCIVLVKSLVLKTALEMSIPLVAFGWSPGQAPIQSAIMKTNAALIRKNQMVMRKVFEAEFGMNTERYFIPETYYDMYRESFPFNIHPLAFFEYNEEEIKLQLNGLGWRSPPDTDSNSSNCLLNAFANHCHFDRHGFNPYVWEIANMVRQGVMSRAEGIQKIYSEQNPNMVEYAKERLDL